MVPGAQQSNSAIHTHVSIFPQTPLPSSLPHSIEQSSLCYTIGPCWISTLNIAVYISPVQLLSRVWLFATPWTAACQASLSITNTWSLPKLTSIESVMPSNHLILCRPLLLPSIFPSIRVFSNKSGLRIRWPQSFAASASASALPMNIQDWFPLGLTGWISLQSKGLSRVFSNTTVQKHQFFCIQLSL